MLRISSENERRFRKLMAVLMLLLLTSMIGCKGSLVVVDGDEMISVKKSTLDTLYSDNERLLKALEKCK